VKPYLAILRKHRHPIKFVLSKLLMKMHCSRFLTIRQNGYILKFYPTSFSANLWIDPQMRAEDDQAIRALLRDGDVVIDVGANIGTTVLTASKAVGDTGWVYAFEAHPRTFNYLKGNIELNRVKNVFLYNTAVGDKRGTVYFSDTRWDDMNGVVSQDSGIEVPIDKLDELIPFESEVALLKVDVEGYEKFVLEGANELLKRTACVYFEVYDKHFAEHHYSSQTLIAFLQVRGFTVFRLHIADGVSLMPLTPEFEAEECVNLLAVRSVEQLLEKSRLRLQT
jgi:FkbM family methyltransferase